MGKGGRIVCIATPMLLTIASFICLILIELSGWNAGMLPEYYFVSRQEEANLAGWEKA